jgi:hypothetical protein
LDKTEAGNNTYDVFDSLRLVLQMFRIKSWYWEYYHERFDTAEYDV